MLVLNFISLNMATSTLESPRNVDVEKYSQSVAQINRGLAHNPYRVENTQVHKVEQVFLINC